jgi:hypothetical protein
MIANPAAGGAGLNLLGYPPGHPELASTDCTLSMYMSQNWSSIHRRQSEARNHRRGTRKPIRYLDFVVAGTIDETIRVRVLKKIEASYSISDVREILRAIRDGVVDEE